MNEKRFELLLPNAIINDTIVRKSYYLSEKDDVEKLVGVLNEQQDTISQLKEENEQLKGENNMLKITIDRNESYIRRLTHQSDWHC